MTTDWDGPIVDSETVAVLVNSLLPETTYYFEMETRNDVGAALGSVRQFTTLIGDVPSVPIVPPAQEIEDFLL